MTVTDALEELKAELRNWPSLIALVNQAVREAVAAEREACARVAELCKTERPDDYPPPSPQEGWEDHGHNSACDWVAMQIRGRK